MSSYRPIRQKEAWCSVQNSDLTISERYGQFYLLTSPHTNTIGCYQLVTKIAAVEAGLSTEEFENVLARLEAKRVACFRSGYVLVRTWFRHSTWESTFTGKVRKRAIAELLEVPSGLRPLWEEASMEAGVPKEVLEGLMAKPLGSPSEGASKGLRNTNTNGTSTKRDDTDTSIEAAVAASLSHGEKVVGCEIALLEIAEPYRPVIEHLAVSHDLSCEQIQGIAYEFSQRLEDAEMGRGKPIAQVKRWLETLAAVAKQGGCVLDRGANLSKRMAADAKRRKEELLAEECQRAQEDGAAARRSRVANVLQSATSDELREIADLAAVQAARPSMPKGVRDLAREAAMSRTVPSALAGVAVTSAVESWLSGKGQTV